MDKFLELAAKVFKVDVSKLSESTVYNSIAEWDSLNHLRLVGEAEDEYEIEIPIEAVPDLKTLGAFYEYIKNK